MARPRIPTEILELRGAFKKDPQRKRLREAEEAANSDETGPMKEPATRNYSAEAFDYAKKVVAGEIVACQWVILACQRHLRDMERAGFPRAGSDLTFPYLYSEEAAHKACQFIESLPHTKGDWAKKKELIRLEPWQLFGLCSIFGWIEKETGLRRFREVYWNVPRKNGKSIIAGGIGIYMLSADGEFGAEVYTGATSKDQAFEVFQPAKFMMERSGELREKLGIKVRGANMSIQSNGSKFEPVIGKPGDGASPSCHIADEYHEHRTDAQIATMRTGMMARSQPLLFIITTAGSNLGGPCHLYQRDVERMLEGKITREDLFGIIYTVDEGDDWTSLAALRKANPNFGISVNEKVIVAAQLAAIQSTRLQNDFKTKHLNLWVGADVAWMNMELWKKGGDPELKPSQFKGLPCCGASDLSSKLDLTANVKVFRKRIDKDDHYYVFGRFYVPENRANEPELERYAHWVIDGHLQTTPGHMIDYQTIADDAISDIKDFSIQEWAFDPWNAEQFAQTLVKATPVVAVEVPQQPRHLSEPMKQLEALVIGGRLHHDGNPVLAWMISNVVAHVDAKDNVFPNKEKPESKIDGAVALIMALSRVMVSAPKKSIYSTRGVLTT